MIRDSLTRLGLLTSHSSRLHNCCRHADQYPVLSPPRTRKHNQTYRVPFLSKVPFTSTRGIRPSSSMHHKHHLGKKADFLHRNLMRAAFASWTNRQATPHPHVAYVTIWHVEVAWNAMHPACPLCTEYLQPGAVCCPAKHMAHETAGFAASWSRQRYTAFALIVPQQSHSGTCVHPCDQAEHGR